MFNALSIALSIFFLHKLRNSFHFSKFCSLYSFLFSIVTAFFSYVFFCMCVWFAVYLNFDSYFQLCLLNLERSSKMCEDRLCVFFVFLL